MFWHTVYTESNCEECFACAAFLSEKEAKRWIRNVYRRGHKAKLFIVKSGVDEVIDLEVK